MKWSNFLIFFAIVLQAVFKRTIIDLLNFAVISRVIFISSLKLISLSSTVNFKIIEYTSKIKKSIYYSFFHM
jgi:hypothetical protein